MWMRGADFVRLLIRATKRRRRPLSPSNSSRPNQERQNNRPNNTPADPRDVGMGRLTFENFLMNGHQEFSQPLTPPAPPRLRPLPSPSYPIGRVCARSATSI